MFTPSLYAPSTTGIDLVAGDGDGGGGRARGAEGRHSDDLAGDVHQRAARGAGGHRGRGLNEAGQGLRVRGQGARGAADDALARGAGWRRLIADGDDDVADLNAARIAECRRREGRWTRRPDHSEVGPRIGAADGPGVVLTRRS